MFYLGCTVCKTKTFIIITENKHINKNSWYSFFGFFLVISFIAFPNYIYAAMVRKVFLSEFWILILLEHAERPYCMPKFPSNLLHMSLYTIYLTKSWSNIRGRNSLENSFKNKYHPGKIPVRKRSPRKISLEEENLTSTQSRNI